MKYRKKPIVIEAEQWFQDKDVDGVQYRYDSRCQNCDYYYLLTL
jgi:hypothetical protein